VVLLGSPMKIHNSSILVPSIGPDSGFPLDAIQTRCLPVYYLGVGNHGPHALKCCHHIVSLVLAHHIRL